MPSNIMDGTEPYVVGQGDVPGWLTGLEMPCRYVDGVNLDYESAIFSDVVGSPDQLFGPPRLAGMTISFHTMGTIHLLPGDAVWLTNDGQLGFRFGNRR